MNSFYYIYIYIYIYISITLINLMHPCGIKVLKSLFFLNLKCCNGIVVMQHKLLF